MHPAALLHQFGCAAFPRRTASREWVVRAVPAPAGRGRRFFRLNVCSAALRSCAVAIAGLSASYLIARLVEDFHRHESLIAGLLVVLAATLLAIRWLGAKSRPPSGAS
jgi:membrane protein DedA with SNARE-associated domain